MPNPTSRDLQIVDPVLTNMSVAYVQSDTVYMAGRVFPQVETDVQGGKYPVYDKGDWLRSVARVRAPGTESAGGGWRVSSAGFYVDVIAVHKDIDDQTRAVAASRASNFGTSLEAAATRWVTGQCLLKRDIQWVTAFFTPGVWTTQRDGVAAGPTGTQFLRWDVVGSTPITDIKSALLTFRQKTGYPGNFVVMGPFVWSALTEHASVLARIQYVERGIVSTDLLASLWSSNDPGNPLNIYVAWAVQNTATEGAADNIDFIAGKHLLVGYATDTPSLMEPSAGYTFTWTGYPGGEVGGIRINNFRIDPIKSDRIEGEYASSPAIVSSDLATFFANAVS